LLWLGTEPKKKRKITLIKIGTLSRLNPVVEAKIVDLRDKFRDAFTGLLEIKEAA